MEKRDRKYDNNKIFVFILLVVVILFAFYFSGILRKNCKDDTCFNNALSSCTPAELIKQRNNNVYIYSVKPSMSEECTLNIELAKVAPGTDFNFRKALEGKSMECKLPKTISSNTDFEDINNLLQYCHGSLKEGILELILEKMYTQVIINMNDIIEETQV